jgi:hypothetical protein
MAEWQDNVMAASSVIMNAALIPSLIAGPAPTLFTSVPTTLCLFAVAASLWTMHLRRASAVAWLCCVLWSALAFQGAGGVELVARAMGEF